MVKARYVAVDVREGYNYSDSTGIPKFNKSNGQGEWFYIESRNQVLGQPNSPPWSTSPSNCLSAAFTMPPLAQQWAAHTSERHPVAQRLQRAALQAELEARAKGELHPMTLELRRASALAEALDARGCRGRWRAKRQLAGLGG